MSNVPEYYNSRNKRNSNRYYPPREVDQHCRSRSPTWDVQLPFEDKIPPKGTYTRSWLDFNFKFLLWLAPVCIVAPILAFIGYGLVQITGFLVLVVANILSSCVSFCIIAAMIYALYFVIGIFLKN